MMKKLTPVMSCGAVAVLCSGCLLLKPIQQEINCTVIKDQFEDMQEMAAKGEVMFGIKVYESEAEIQEVLEANVKHYGNHWKKNNCSGSLTDAQ